MMDNIGDSVGIIIMLSVVLVYTYNLFFTVQENSKNGQLEKAIINTAIYVITIIIIKILWELLHIN